MIQLNLFPTNGFIDARKTKRKSKVKDWLEQCHTAFLSPYTGVDATIQVICDQCLNCYETTGYQIYDYKHAHCSDCVRKNQHKTKRANNNQDRAPFWFVQRYYNIKYRCEKAHPQYHNRGIQCEFPTCNAMWDYVSTLDNCAENMTLDRINVNGNYAVGNLRWANQHQQSTNKQVHLNPTVGIREYIRKNGSSSFRVYLKSHGVNRYIGQRDSLEEAQKLRKQAEDDYWL